MTCANGPEDAVYLVADPGANEVYYCRIHLPVHLYTRAESGEYALPPASEPAPKKAAASK